MENIEPKTRREFFLNKIAEAAGGNAAPGKFTVTFSGVTNNGSNTAACDHTHAEILEAYNAGRVIEGKYNNYILSLHAIGEGLARFSAEFHAVYGEEPVWYAVTAVVYNDGDVEVHTDGEV